MSLPSSPNTPAPAAQKQGTNIYTVMLILAFLALTTGSILLYMELTKYGSFPYWGTGA
jgi:hypothetical protein